MKKNISIKKIFILLGTTLGGLILFLFIIWLIGGLAFSARDKKENKERAEFFYKELGKKYKTNGNDAFKMNYTYDMKTNIGFFNGGGFTENGCLEKYIRDAWTNKEIIFISLCENEKITKEKLDALNNFWGKYEEILGSE